VIFTQYGMAVRVVRLATTAEFKRYFIDRRTTKTLCADDCADDCAVVEAIGGSWSGVRHISELRADDGLRELTSAFADAKARAVAQAVRS
jgi:hypothetical protein